MPKKDPTPEEREAQLTVCQDAARELECDDDPERFDERVKRMAKGTEGGARDAGMSVAHLVIYLTVRLFLFLPLLAVAGAVWWLVRRLRKS